MKNFPIELIVLDKRIHEWGGLSYSDVHTPYIYLHACIEETIHLQPLESARLISAGFSFHIKDPNIAALILPMDDADRSGLVLGNGVGLIDSDYMGPLMVSTWYQNHDTRSSFPIHPGQKIARLIFIPVIHPVFNIVENFEEESSRSSGGFGSTGL